MAPLVIDENAGWLAGIIFAASVLWKVWLRFRDDKRADKAAERSHEAEGSVLGSYDRLIKQLREEVERLAKDIEDEREARYEAESQARALQIRVELLEQRLRDLGQKM